MKITPELLAEATDLVDQIREQLPEYNTGWVLQALALVLNSKPAAP